MNKKILVGALASTLMLMTVTAFAQPGMGGGMNRFGPTQQQGAGIGGDQAKGGPGMKGQNGPDAMKGMKCMGAQSEKGQCLAMRGQHGMRGFMKGQQGADAKMGPQQQEGPRGNGQMKEQQAPAALAGAEKAGGRGMGGGTKGGGRGMGGHGGAGGRGMGGRGR